MRMDLGEFSVRVSAAASGYSDRLTVSSGISRARAAAVARGYSSEAWIPRPPFRPVAEWESRAASGAQCMHRSRTVGLACIAPAVLDGLRADAACAERPGGLGSHSEILCDCLAAEWDIEEPPRGLSFGRNPPGLATVTRDPDSGRFVGLHVDTFHDNYSAARSNAGNRVSVNIGKEARFFLFIPLSFRELYVRSGGEDRRCANFVARFLEDNPDQCVLRLRVDPGEAYIAPTENIVHDASSLPSLCEDLHVTGRGIFNPRPC